MPAAEVFVAAGVHYLSQLQRRERYKSALAEVMERHKTNGEQDHVSNTDDETLFEPQFNILLLRNFGKPKKPTTARAPSVSAGESKEAIDG